MRHVVLRSRTNERRIEQVPRPLIITLLSHRIEREQDMAKQHSVDKDIDAVIRGGLAVRDASGMRVGMVGEYSNAAAYMVVATRMFDRRDLYIPYSAITSINPREIYLNQDSPLLAISSTNRCTSLYPKTFCSTNTAGCRAAPSHKPVENGATSVAFAPGEP